MTRLSTISRRILLASMQTRTSRPVRVPPRDELINVPEFEDAAKIALDAPAYSTIAGGDRAAFERITFRPLVLMPTLDLDLSVELFGDSHFAPILVGPVSDQRRFHTPRCKGFRIHGQSRRW